MVCAHDGYAAVRRVLFSMIKTKETSNDYDFSLFSLFFFSSNKQVEPVHGRWQTHMLEHYLQGHRLTKAQTVHLIV